VAAQTIKLKSVEFYNFKSFLKGKYVFPEEGLVSIEAENKETGGSSGAGKSTFLNAIAFALGYCEFPASTLKGWNSDDDMRVVLTLSTAEGDVEISKGSKNYLKVGNTTITGAKAIEERLKSIIGLDSDTLKALVYRRQKSNGLFLTMDDTEKKDFLGRVMNLDRYENAIEESKKRVSTLKGLVSASEPIIQSCKTTEPQKPVLQELVLDEHRDTIESAKKAVQTAADGELLIKAQIDKQTSEYHKYDTAFVAETSQKEAEARKAYENYLVSFSFAPDTTELDTCVTRQEQIKVRFKRVQVELDNEKKAYQESVKVKSGEVSRLKHMASGVPSLQRQLVGLLSDKEKAEKSICFTCEREGFVNPNVLSSLEAKILKTQGEIKLCEDARDSLAGLTAELDSLSPPDEGKYQALLNAMAVEQGKEKGLRAALVQQESVARSQHSVGGAELKNALNAIINDNAQKRAKYQDKHYSTVNKLKETLLSYSNDKVTYLSAQNTAQRELDRMMDQYKLDCQQYEKNLSSYQSYLYMEKKLVEQKKELATESEVAELLKSFVGGIFEEILIEVADETNDILAAIPNVSHCSIQFSTETVTQKGSTKQKITPVVHVGQNSGPIKTVCSGGMETAIELAVDIAVASVIARRTGASPQWIVLDEAFDGLDNAAKEACLEILQKHANDKLVMVVSHVSDFREFFTSAIRIEYKDGKSEVV